MSAAGGAVQAATEAATVARKALGQAKPKLAIVFASVSYPDVAGAARAVRNVVGDVQIIGGTSGACVFATEGTAGRGVSVVLLGGDDVEVVGKSASCRSASLVETVPAAEEIARAAERAAARGFPHYACLAFAPGIFVDGEAFVAAVRKGAGAHAQLAGALTGDDLTMDRPKVLFGDELHDDRTVVTGIFTKSPVGVAARHGWRAVGPSRTVTRADGIHLVELDGRPALDVWLEDARNAGAEPPSQREEVLLYLANRYPIGIADASQSKIRVADDERRELVARTPISLRDDGAFKMSASIAEGTTVRVMHASPAGMLRASGEAAAAAAARVGGKVSGALVLACAGRLGCLGDAFSQEPLAIQREIGAPIGGACVFGEVARNVRDVDAFFNTTAVVVAFGG